MAAAIERAVRSMAPPAANVATRWIGFDGNCCAPAPTVQMARTTAARMGFMGNPPVILVSAS
jgi:hypothetical protein